MSQCKQQSDPVCRLFRRLAVSLAVLAYAPFLAYAQEMDLKGSVTDSDGEPLIGASVFIKDTDIGVITDLDGRFSITASKGNVLVVSYIGFATTEYTVDSMDDVSIILTAAGLNLDEVVVIGYGTQKKETLVGSVATVKSKELVQAPVANISNALVGRVPGLSSVQASGEPGDNSSSIYIRGVATLNSEGTSPLIMIDGVESTIATMNAIDANDIASMSVLKDASATAVYGVKGANGVILINTRRGKEGMAKVDLSYRFGVTELVSKLDLLGSAEYAILRNEAIRNDADPSKEMFLFSEEDIWKFANGKDFTQAEIWGNFPWLPEEQKLAIYNSPALYYTDNDYYDMTFGGLAPQHQVNVNVSGGFERVRYFASVGYYSQEGQFQNAKYMDIDNNSKYNRYNFRTNLDIEAASRLAISIDFSGIISTSAGILGSAQDGDPTSQYARHKAMLGAIFSSPPYNGSGIIDGKLVNGFVYDRFNEINDKGCSGWSPMANLLTRPLMTTTQTDISATVRLNHSMDYLTDGLSLSGTFSYSDWQKKGVITTNANVPQWRAMRNPDNPAEILFIGGTLQPSTVEDQQYKSKWNRMYMEAKLDYNRTFGKHNVTGLVLYNAQLTNAPYFAFQVPEGRIGLVGRATYNYDQRYMFEFNMGYNGSENFAPGKRFGFFPAVSAGWILTNEPFWKENVWVSLVKIRGSYGEVGNDQIGGSRFLYLPSTWSISNDMVESGYWWGNGNGSASDMYYQGAKESTIGNPDVTWERARKTNVGLDLGFFKNRLSVVFDYFNEDRDKILTQYLSQTNLTGASYPPGNIGKVNNHGFEVQVAWSDSIEDFFYTIGGSFSYARNKILFMDEPAYAYPWMNTTGFSVGQYKGVQSEGFYNNDAEASNRPYVQEGGNVVHAGDIRFVDIDGDGVINDKDYIPIGYSNLPRINYNITLNAEWRGIYLSALFVGTAQGSMQMADFYILNPFYMNNGVALQWHYDTRWTPERAAAGENIEFPRASMTTYNTHNKLPNDLWIRSSQFFRLKNLEVGYSLPKKWIEKARMSNVRIYFSSNNLFTWGSRLLPGFDPEQADQGGASSGYLYPPTRSYNVGLNISF